MNLVHLNLNVKSVESTIYHAEIFWSVLKVVCINMLPSGKPTAGRRMKHDVILRQEAVQIMNFRFSDCMKHIGFIVFEFKFLTSTVTQ